MKNLIITAILAGSLGFLLVWGLAQFNSSPEATDSVNDSLQPSLLNTQSEAPTQSRASELGTFFESQTTLIQEALHLDRPQQALELFDEAYAELSSPQADQLAYLLHAYAMAKINEGRSSQIIEWLNTFAETYNHLGSWELLAMAYQQTEDWRGAMQALIRVTQLEIVPERIDTVVRNIQVAASKISTQFERDGDSLGSLELYQSLYDTFPQYPRFAFDLAKAHLELGSMSEARRLLQQVSYDPTLGPIAQKQLALLEQELAQNNSNTKNRLTSSLTAGEIMVPLSRVGSSLQVSASLAGSQAQLLLDTGASITAISHTKIAQLNLSPLNRVVRLSTANGEVQAPLYRVSRLSLGQIQISDLVVAGIDLPSNSGFDGLLGTDVLSSMSESHNYLIDDQNNALIFVPR